MLPMGLVTELLLAVKGIFIVLILGLESFSLSSW